MTCLRTFLFTESGPLGISFTATFSRVFLHRQLLWVQDWFELATFRKQAACTVQNTAACSSCSSHCNYDIHQSIYILQHVSKWQDGNFQYLLTVVAILRSALCFIIDTVDSDASTQACIARATKQQQEQKPTCFLQARLLHTSLRPDTWLSHTPHLLSRGSRSHASWPEACLLGLQEMQCTSLQAMLALALPANITQLKQKGSTHDKAH